MEENYDNPYRSGGGSDWQRHHRYSPSQARKVATALSYSPSVSSGDGALATSTPTGTADHSHFFGPKNNNHDLDQQGYSNHSSSSGLQESADVASPLALGQQSLQARKASHHQQLGRCYDDDVFGSASPPAAGNDVRRSSTSVAVNTSPPVGSGGGGGGGYAPESQRYFGDQDQLHLHRQRQQQQWNGDRVDDARSPMSVVHSPERAERVEGLPPPFLQQQPQEQESSAVSAIIADVTARRTARSRSQQVWRDADIVRRSNTPMSESRQAGVQPRPLWLELDAAAAGAGPPVAATASRRGGGVGGETEAASVLGRRKARESQDDHASGSAVLRQAGDALQEENEESGEEDEEEDTPRNILALCKYGDKLGVAAYREAVNAIDIQETHAFLSDMTDTIENIKVLVRPRLILTDLNMTNHPGLFEVVLAPLLQGGDPIEHRLMKKSSWDYESAVRGICASLQVQSLKRNKPGDAVGDGDGGEGGGRRVVESGAGGGSNPPLREAFNRLGSVIDFQAHQQVRALGALLVNLQSTIFSLEASGSVVVSDVRQLDSSGSMRIDAMTLRSLGIMAEEFHPNVINEKGRSKEGYSVFALFHRTKSAPGRRCLKEWLLKPLHDIAAIGARQDSVEVLMKAENAEICQKLRLQLTKLHDITKIVIRITKVASTWRDWTRLIQSLEFALDIRQNLVILERSADAAVAVEGSFGHQAFLARLLDNIDAVALRHCLEGLCAVIDRFATAKEKEVVICPGFDEELDRMMNFLDDLPEILQRVGKIVLYDNPLLDELSVEYVPQIGFLTALHGTPEDMIPKHFEFAFAQGETVYFKNKTMREVDDGIGDIQGRIADGQAKIMRELEEALLVEASSLHAAAAALAELDAVLALAEVAGDFGFVRPEVVEENVVVIKSGRHPLQELAVDLFIPNDTYIADDSRVSLITGANCSGKSVYLKQVGVTVYLAHVGSFVPAEKAIIGLTDRIFTRIATFETSAIPQSSFTIDVNQVAHMVRSSTPRSLLLIDEFGKGTAPADGIGLVAALLRHLSRADRKCLFTMHFHEIFSQGLVKVHSPDEFHTELPNVSVFRMDVHVPPLPREASGSQSDGLLGEDGDPADRGVEDDGWASTLPTPLFKLVPGIATNSHGIACAQLAGLPDRVLSRTREVTCFEDRGEPIRAQGGRLKGAGLLTLASPEVQEALRLFITPPNSSSWKDASDDLVGALLAAVETLCGLGVAGG